MSESIDTGWDECHPCMEGSHGACVSDACSCREADHLGGERVPEGWTVRWPDVDPDHCVFCKRWSKVPQLVPVSPSEIPEEGNE